MNLERDQFLTEAMGECWHEFHTDPLCGCICKVCGLNLKCLNLQHPDFSTWDGFGKLWKWSQQQEWFYDFVYIEDADDSYDIIDPDKLANALYEFLKDK